MSDVSQSTPKAQSIFAQAVENVPPQQWSGFLEQACGDDDALRRQVQRLLDAHADSDSFMKQPAAVAATIDLPGEIPAAPGTVIGPYKLRERIGEGGFGVVYVAEQTEPVRRKVALKIIKPGMDTREIIARFEAERQALAMMDHPNIARVLDAGTTGENPKSEARNPKQIQSTKSECQKRPGDEVSNIPDSNFEFVSDFGFRDSNFRAAGRPYFVMELVKGIPITEFCDEQKLSTRERLELFVQVCRAVQHAHTKGIIHRDLKPSNVMVTLHDATPVPKVIDFGVAKALSSRLTEKTVYTAYGQMIGTPLYMSPEQAQLNEIDVDTRSDIYSLGVLLYELLTGTTPFDKETLQKSGFDEMRRIIREVDPPRPSARLSTLQAKALSTVAEERHVDPRKLSGSLRGELDWIVMKALEKDRNRRYETANGLARDIERYLNDEPVHARPPSTAYRFQKFARRNKGLLTVATVVGLAFVLGIGGTTWQAIRATHAERSARAERDRALKAEQLATQRLTRARKAERKAQAEAGKAKQAAADAQAQRKRAEANLQLALDALDNIYLRLAEEEFAELPDLSQEDYEFLQAALPFYERLAGQKADDPQMQFAQARAYHRVGNVYALFRQKQPEADADAEAALTVAIDLYRELAERWPDNVEHRHRLARAEWELGTMSIHIGSPEKAEPLLRDSLAVLNRIENDLPPAQRHQVAYVHNLLALSLMRQDKYEASESVLREGIRQAERFVEAPPDVRTEHIRLGEGLRKLGETLKHQNRIQEAEEAYQKSLAVLEQIEDRDGFQREAHQAQVLLSQSHLLKDAGRTDEAKRHYRRVTELLEDSDHHWHRSMAAGGHHNLADILLESIRKF